MNISTKSRTHLHAWDIHPKLSTHLACTICGFAAPIAAHMQAPDACLPRQYTEQARRGLIRWDGSYQLTDAGLEMVPASAKLSSESERQEWEEAEANQAKVDAADKGSLPHDV